MTMTIGLDGLMESPDSKSIFKASKTKVHPKLNINDYEDQFANQTNVPDSGKYDSRSKFHIDREQESQTGMHSQESVFENKKKSTSSDTRVFNNGQAKRKQIFYGD